jgi:polar amino acid transport system substrate-binding protein
MLRSWARFGGAALAAGVLVCASIVPLLAQPVVQPTTPAAPRTPSQPNAGTPSRPGVAAPSDDPMAVPSFWDPRRRPERPDLSRINGIRFLTEFDYPPFNYAGADGQLAGFNIDLARLICEEIKTTCTVQARRFDTLIEALTTNNGDAVIASISATPDIRRRIDFSDPYYRTPARFVSRKDVEIDGVRPADLEGRRIGVIAGTAHEAYLRTLFTEAELHSYPNSDDLRAALRRGEIDLLFGDGIALSFWLNGTDSAGCCVFRGGPFTESRFFGEGVGIAVRRGNDLMRQAINWALFRLWESGKYTDLWLRYFPISPF